MGMSIILFKLYSGYTSVPESGSCLSLSSVAPLSVTGTTPAWNHGNKAIMHNWSLTNNNIVHVLMRNEKKEARSSTAHPRQSLFLHVHNY